MSDDHRFGRPSNEEALELSVAFYCIVDPEQRAQVIRLAERLAKESPVVDGVTHFLLLDKSLK